MFSFKNLVNAQDEYIALLIKEIESMVSIAYTHGWRSDNHEAGVMLREKIAALKQEIAKAEQEGPFPVYDLTHLSEEDKTKFAGEVMKSASESLIATFYSLRLQSHLDQMSINDSNGDKFILAFRKIVDDKLLGPPLPMASSKKEHEGPWKSVVHSSVSDTEAGREYDDHVTITDGRVELYFDGGIDDNDEQLLCNLLNERNIKLDYNHEAEMVADFLEKELKRVNALQREQEGLRWVKASERYPDIEDEYHIKRDGIKTSARLHNRTKDYWQLTDMEWLDESTPPVKEAGQPAEEKSFDEDLAYELIARFVANSGKKDSIKKIRKEAFVDGALWAKKYLESRQQPAEKGAVWVKATERLPDKSGSFYCRDLKNNRRSVRFYTAGPTGRNSVFKTRPWDVEWLDESGLASSRESDQIALYKEYIHLLGEEIDSLIPIAHTHGWRSERHEKGVQLRAKIEALTQKI